MVEAYLPATELDSKLHQLTHLVDGIRNLGKGQQNGTCCQRI